MLLTSRVPLALVLALCAMVAADDDGKDNKAAVTTAPIFLPYYHEESWSLVRGSVLSTNKTASETTYTIFCPAEPTPTCDLSLEFPFVIVESPDKVQFHGTYTSTFIADLVCDLDGTTAATCSGYSSYRSGYSNGLHTGPTEISWTSTFSGSAVEWGVLTMAEKPKSTDDSLAITATARTTPASSSGSSGFVYIPAETGKAGDSAGAGLRVDGKMAVLATVGGILLAGCLL